MGFDEIALVPQSHYVDGHHGVQNRLSSYQSFISSKAAFLWRS